jgi:hypothetical protein
LDSAYAGVHNIPSNVSVELFPNPVSKDLKISINARESGKLILELTSLSGQKIRDLTQENIQAGTWTGSFPVTISNGIYFINGSLNGKVFRKKLTVLH